MSHFAAIMTLLVSMLAFISAPTHAAPGDLKRLSSEVSEARDSVKLIREENRAVGQRVNKMTSRLAGMRARLEAQQQQIAKMQTQLKSINALIGKVTGVKVSGATQAATPTAAAPSTRTTSASRTAAAGPAPASVAPAATAPAAAQPAASTQNTATTAVAQAPAPVKAVTPAPVPAPTPATAPAPVPQASAPPAVPPAAVVPVPPAPVFASESWLSGFGDYGLIAAGWLALVVVGSAIAIAMRRRRSSGNRAKGNAREAALREKVSRKAAENLSERKPAQAASFAAAGSHETHAGHTESADARTMDAKPVPDAVAAAVRDSDIYVAYGEMDAAREALAKVLEEYPDDVLLQSRLAALDDTGAPASPSDAAKAASDDDVLFELEPLDADDDSNVLPFKRAM